MKSRVERLEEKSDSIEMLWGRYYLQLICFPGHWRTEVRSPELCGLFGTDDRGILDIRFIITSLI
jgi:hypothetical protein